MVLHDLTEFLRLSAALNLQLSATGVGRGNILSIILHRKPLPDDDKDVLLKVLAYLDQAYGPSRRRLGSPAVLHPLRASALLAAASDTPRLLDLLSELLHDKFEDITPEKIGPDRWAEVEPSFKSLLKTIDPKHEWYLMERLDLLTRRPSETYYQYIGRLADRAHRTPEVVRVKLADRLDNVLDMRIDIEDPMEGVDFFATLFQTLFVNSYGGYRPSLPHPVPAPLNGAQRLYQLFKNALMLSMLRHKQLALNDPTTQVLFDALAIASMKEAERTALHVIGYHETEVLNQRRLLMEVLSYAQDGGMERATTPRSEHPLDGLCLSRFDHVDPDVRREQLDALYHDKALMLQASVAFVVIFLSFVSNPAYYIRGISENGIQA